MDEFISARNCSRWFYFMVLCSQVAGLTLVALIAILFAQYRGGFEWGSDLTKIFNYHPLFMTLGMVFLYGDAILVHRALFTVRKTRTIMFHACLLTLSIIFSSIGLKAVFASHMRADPPEENLFSLHSWVGLATMILLCLQWIFGFLSCLFPRASDHLRKRFSSNYKFWSKVIFGLGVGTVLMGITEYSIFDGLYRDKKIKYQRNMINCFGFAVLIFAAIIYYLISNPGFRRPPEDRIEDIPMTEWRKQ